jgi:hypothetical protein
MTDGLGVSLVERRNTDRLLPKLDSAATDCRTSVDDTENRWLESI